MQETIWEKFFASNEMREHLNQKFKRRDTDSLNRKIRGEKKKNPGIILESSSISRFVVVMCRVPKNWAFGLNKK